MAASRSDHVSDGALDQIMFVVKKKYTRKTSSLNSFFMYGRRVLELVFHVWKTSSMNSFFLVYFSTQILVK